MKLKQSNLNERNEYMSTDEHNQIAQKINLLHPLLMNVFFKLISDKIHLRVTFATPNLK